MRRLVALVLALILMVSHGGMAGAVPHEHDQPTHAAAVDVHDAHDDRHHASDSEDEAAEKSVAHVAHVHVVGDIVQPRSAMAPVAAQSAVRAVASRTVWLRSRAVAPLLEPPAA